MSDTTNADEAQPSSASRRERGISAYAKILAVPEQEVPATFAARVGPAFAEEALQGRRGSRMVAPRSHGAGTQHRHRHRLGCPGLVRRSPGHPPAAGSATRAGPRRAQRPDDAPGRLHRIPASLLRHGDHSRLVRRGRSARHRAPVGQPTQSDKPSRAADRHSRPEHPLRTDEQPRCGDHRAAHRARKPRVNPNARSVRFSTGRHSIDGHIVCYRDARASANPEAAARDGQRPLLSRRRPYARRTAVVPVAER